jgi:hypothetical protein
MNKRIKQFFCCHKWKYSKTDPNYRICKKCNLEQRYVDVIITFPWADVSKDWVNNLIDQKEYIENESNT